MCHSSELKHAISLTKPRGGGRERDRERVVGVGGAVRERERERELCTVDAASVYVDRMIALIEQFGE